MNPFLFAGLMLLSMLLVEAFGWGPGDFMGWLGSVFLTALVLYAVAAVAVWAYARLAFTGRRPWQRR